MFERFDESELLALVEGELDREEAEALRKRLAAADPRVLDAIERMREDRAILRSTAEPPLPAELAELEPLVARPMLMPSAAQLRRRRRRRRPWRLVAAAVVAFGLLAGLWATVVGVRGREGGPGTGSVDVGNPEALVLSAVDVESAASAAMGPQAWPPTGRDVHHLAPAMPPATGGSGGAVPAAGRGPGVLESAALAAEFVLVLEVDDAATAEETLKGLIADLGPRAALVANFDHEEAERLAEAWRVSQAREPVADQPVAVAAGEVESRPVERRRRQPRQWPNGLEDRGQLAGPRELAPSFEQQLAFSAAGAAYTLAIPLDRLPEALARAQLGLGQSTSLRMLGALPGSPGQGEARWLSDYPQVRAAAARLRGNHPDAIVHVAVVIERK